MESEHGKQLGVSVIGFGYWGPNIVRNLVERPEFDVLSLCELSDARARDFSRRYPGIAVIQDFDEVLADPRVDAVSIVTPPRTHAELAKRALEAGKHVLVEKPLATTAEDARELIAIAQERGLVLMPGHTFVYSPPVNKVRELIKTGVVGETYFVTSSRMNLGIYQGDGVILDLAPHDLSILLYWLDAPVVQVTATGKSVYRNGVHETAFLTLTFADETAANIQISWLSPRKVRQMVVVGSKRMVQYEDTAADESVRVYDRGLDRTEPTNFGEYRMTYRTGDMVAPRIEPQEPLSLELADFALAINTGCEPRSNARLGLEIVRVLEAAAISLECGGRPVELEIASDGLHADPVDPVVAQARLAAHANGDAAANGNGNGNGRRFTRPPQRLGSSK
jgi:predicted dehydrogenase